MANSPQPEARNNSSATCVSKNADEDTAEQIDDEDSVDHDDTAVRSGSTLLVGGGATISIARREGIDRHAEADHAEWAFDKTVAKKTGGTIVEDRTSAFTPDGGIDSVIETESGYKYIQTKHYGRKVSESTIKKYADDVDVIGATNGVKEGCTPEEYGVDIVTSSDWPYRARATLEFKRIARGYRKGVAGIVNGTHDAATYLVDGTKFGGRLVYMGGKSIWHNVTKTASAAAVRVAKASLRGGKSIRQKIAKTASAAVVRFAKASLRKKAAMGIVGLIILYLIYQWYTDENEDNWIK